MTGHLEVSTAFPGNAFSNELINVICGNTSVKTYDCTYSYLETVRAKRPGDSEISGTLFLYQLTQAPPTPATPRVR